MYRQNLKKWLSFVLCIAVLLSCMTGLPAEAAGSESSFQIHFIDVGQADAALIVCDGQAMLIDGGNVADSQIMYSYMQKMNISHLEYVIGTHAHEDHIGGIAGALQYVQSVGTVYCPVESYTGSAFPKFVTAVQNHGKTIQIPTVGTTFSLGSALCKIIAVNTPSDDVNDSSIVMRITYGNNSFMFTGDAELPVETFLLDSDETLKSDVLKVGHHGSASSTSYLWLREVDPDYAVICVGEDNEYGHPTETVLSRLRDAEVKTYRTDMQGDIVCSSDGTDITFTVARNPDADTFGGIGSNSTVAPDDPKQIVDEAYGLADNASLSYTATLTGKVTRINTPFSAADNNTVTVTMTVTGRENYPILCFKMSGPGADQLEVGSIITVVGIIKKYVSSSGYSTVEFYYPSLIDWKSEASVDGSSDTVSATAATAVKLNTPYKLALDRNGVKYYFTGETDSVSYYLAASTDAAAAVTVYLEGTTDSYRLYFYKSGVKTYIRLYERTAGTANNGKPNLQLTTAVPAESYRFDPELKTLVYTKDSNNSYYMGTYSNYTNIRASNLYYVSGSNFSNVDISQFPVRFYEELEELTVKTQPSDIIIRYGATAPFTVAATGTGLTYQWQYRTSSTDSWKNVSAASGKTASYSLTAAIRHNGYQYRCEVTDSAGNEIYTKVVNLYVLGIKTQPASNAVKAGATARFTVAATGNGLTYQWQYRTSSSGSWKNVSAASGKTANYSLTAATRHDGYQYRCEITDSANNTVYTDTVTLNVLGIKTQPVSNAVKAGATARFTVAATGNGLTYQWQYRTSSSGSWKNVSAASGKTANYSLTAATRHDGYQYRCEITDSANNTVYTDTVTLNVLGIKTQPVSNAVKAGATARFTVAATGNGLTYQWQYRTSSSGSWKNVSAASGKTANYSLTAAIRHDGYQYRCKITDTYGNVIYTNIVKLTVKK